MTRSNPLIAFFIAVVSGVIVGCGTSSPDPLSKTAFLDQGNAICREARQEQNASLKQATEETASGSHDQSAEAEVLVSEGALPPVENMAEELMDLGAPKGDEHQVEAIASAFTKTVEKLEADPESVTADSFAAANRKAQAYGLYDCTV